jgi:hypothetical protein
VAKTTPIPGHVLPLSKARIASARILSTTVVLGQLGNQEEPQQHFRKGLFPRGTISIAMKSRVRRESHARFCERLVVKPLRPTRPLVKENRALQAVNARLTKKLKNAELIIEVQKKVAALLGNPIPNIQIDEEN